MTPKDKAIELVDRFSDKANEFEEPTTYEFDKQCALICVDEMIKSNPTAYITFMYHENLQDKIDSAIDYLNEVKKEIEKL